MKTQIEGISTERNSSIELLRIILMVFIVMHHTINTVYPNFSNHGFAALDVVLHTAVIIFVLITGFFGLHFKTRRLLDLMLTLIFYSAGLTILYSALYKSSSPLTIVKSFFPVSSSAYWFMTTYVELYFIAPFLNKLFKQLTDERYITLLVVFAVFVFWFGLVWKGNICNDGKDIVNFIFIYSIGHGLARYKTNRTMIKFCSRKMSLTMLTICIIIVSMSTLLPDSHNLFVHFMAYTYVYNSPFLIFLAVVIFNLFNSVTYHNHIINYLSSSSLAIYLIHEHPLMRTVIYVIPFTSIDKSNGIRVLVIITGFAIAISIICMLADKLRALLFSLINKPLNFTKIRY